MTSVKKRFIAGAVCPACGATDTLYVLKVASGTSRHCTRCDLNETLSSIAPRDPDKDGETPASGDWQPVRLATNIATKKDPENR